MVREARHHRQRRGADADAAAGQGEIVREKGPAHRRRVQGDRRARARQGAGPDDVGKFTSTGRGVAESRSQCGLTSSALPRLRGHVESNARQRAVASPPSTITFSTTPAPPRRKLAASWYSGDWKQATPCSNVANSITMKRWKVSGPSMI